MLGTPPPSAWWQDMHIVEYTFFPAAMLAAEGAAEADFDLTAVFLVCANKASANTSNSKQTVAVLIKFIIIFYR
jgi:hypothetical protein